MHKIPSSLPPLFSGDRLMVYGLLKPSENASQDGKNEVRLQGVLGRDEQMEHLITFSTPPTAAACDADLESNSSVFLHCIAAKTFIKEKQDDISGMRVIEDDKTSIIRTSKSANVVSKFTSFVAVDKDNHEPVCGPLRKQVIPSFGHSPVLCSQMMSYAAAPVVGGFAPASYYDHAQSMGALQSNAATLSAQFHVFSSCPKSKKKKGGFGFGSMGSSAKSAPPKANSEESAGRFSFLPKSLFGSPSPPPPPPQAAGYGGGVPGGASLHTSLFASAPTAAPQFQPSCYGGSAPYPSPLTAAASYSKPLFGSAPPPPQAAVYGGGAPYVPPAPTAASQKRKEAPSVLSLISLQTASGAWELTDQLVSLCSTSRDALITGCPAEIAVDNADGKLLWATALALVLLMGKFLDQKDEWEMIAEKGKKWMKKNLPAAVTYDKVLEVAATAVGVQI